MSASDVPQRPATERSAQALAGGAPLELGFLVYVGGNPNGHPASALRSGLELFRHGDHLGIDSGWVRVHHHAPSLSAPFPFLAAAARETRGIRLGAGVIPVGYEDPLRFAEDAATTDLLSDGRLEVGLSSGLGLGVGVRGAAPDAAREAAVRARLAEITAAVRGEVLGSPYADRFAPPTDEPEPDARERLLPAGAGLPVATPHSAGLADRLWYGAGRVASARRAGEQGFNLLLSTLSTEVAAPTLGLAQAEQIAAYRAAFAAHHPGRRSRVAISRTIVPMLDRADRDRFGELIRREAEQLAPNGVRRDAAANVQWSPLYGGEPERIAELLRRDPALALADTLIFVPPTGLALPQQTRLLDTVSGAVAPLLGWRPRPTGIPAPAASHAA